MAPGKTYPGSAMQPHPAPCNLIQVPPMQSHAANPPHLAPQFCTFPHGPPMQPMQSPCDLPPPHLYPQLYIRSHGLPMQPLATTHPTWPLSSAFARMDSPNCAPAAASRPSCDRISELMAITCVGGQFVAWGEEFGCTGGKLCCIRWGWRPQPVCIHVWCINT